jgi:hypothetical protein
MWWINPNLIEDAKIKAEGMLKTGVEIKPIKFGKRLDIIFVTTDHSLIVPLVYFELGGKRFYFGYKLEERNPK